MPISSVVEGYLERASWIRRMFEEGIRMRQIYGADKVFDFTLGNPIVEPPVAFQEALRQAALHPMPGGHRYMQNAGYPEVRDKVARHVSREMDVPLDPEDIIMTCGSGGALNISLKSLLEPGDEVVVIAPFFPEYTFYIENHAGVQRVAESTQDFDLDLGALDAAIGQRTKAIILNSPNNPTGRAYSQGRLQGLGELLQQKEKAVGHPICLLSDEPYRGLLFDGLKPINAFKAHPNTIFAYSFSKDFGLAGERIGFAAISPYHVDRIALRSAMTFVNRTLGYINAPALFQRTVAEVLDAPVEVEVYRQLRDRLYEGLLAAGLRCFRPQGTFYIFPATPLQDDLAFVRELLKERILTVPGSGFGRSGHMRLSLCVSPREIEGALPGLQRVVEACLAR
jgi:aspartate aminotransferase